uniref:CCHC-type domain-containing protein n=1 Tax=Tanacetum cinerariifolium TaxID=118510 RepID=A0A6L2M9J8_TANCI|nr:hypothetical protein [Tanacetum cinerariifolium]
MGIPNEHPLKFNSIKDAKQLLEAVEKRFSRNAATKKTQRNFLKQQYENFIALNSGMLDQTFDRLQKLVSQLELLGEKLSQDDVNQKDEFEMANGYLIMRARRFLKKTGRKLTINGNETIGFDKSNVECYNCYKRGHFAKECRAPRNQDIKHKKSIRRSVPVETPASTAFVSCDGLGGYHWSDQAEEGLDYALMAFTSSSSDTKKGLRYKSYNAVPPPYTENFMPLKPDLSYTSLDEFADKPVAENTNFGKEETNAVRKNIDALIIEEWVSDDED